MNSAPPSPRSSRWPERSLYRIQGGSISPCTARVVCALGAGAAAVLDRPCALRSGSAQLRHRPDRHLTGHPLPSPAARPYRTSGSHPSPRLALEIREADSWSLPTPYPAKWGPLYTYCYGMSIGPASMWSAVKALLHSVYDQPDAGSCTPSGSSRIVDRVIPGSR